MKILQFFVDSCNWVGTYPGHVSTETNNALAPFKPSSEKYEGQMLFAICTAWGEEAKDQDIFNALNN